MGYQTDFIGYLQIDPPLDEYEADVINRISGPGLGLESGLRVADATDELLRELMLKAPRGWSNWTVCGDGCCLSYDGGDKANHMAPWLEFLMDALLVPGLPRLSASPGPHGHVLNGMVVGSRRDNRELYSITVVDNKRSVELLWPGNPDWSSYPPLRYQTEIDRVRDWIASARASGAVRD